MSSDRHPGIGVAAVAERMTAIARSSLTGVRVFLAEDEPMLLWALEDILGDLGCEVVGSATRVSDALEFVTGHAFDVAVLDGKLADGVIDPVVDILKARGTPFILASGLPSSDFAARFDGAVALQKPFKTADLEAALVLLLYPALARAPDTDIG